MPDVKEAIALVIGILLVVVIMVAKFFISNSIVSFIKGFFNI